jgi:pimeloyl-ACP methyl ester carboxylesterase
VGRRASALIRGVSADANGGPSDAEVAAAGADLFSRNDPHILAVMARTLPSLWDVSRDQLRKVRVPVYAIAGEFEHDNVEAAKRMLAVVPSIQVTELPGVNHATAVRPAVPRVVAFLDAHRAH